MHIGITTTHKVIITGTGRAGTTFLVRLLTELGLDTGYTQNSWQKDFHPHCSAGLERDITDPEAPYIVKSPALCTELAPLLASEMVVIDHAFVPVRDLDAAARSRIRVGGANGSVPGGLWLTDNASSQQNVLATVFHQLIHTLVVHDVPHTFLHFPRFVQDSGYAFQKLKPVLTGITRTTFDAAFVRVADPSLVHDFSKVPSGSSNGLIGREYLERKRRHRRQRQFRRCASWVAAVAALGTLIHLNAGWMPLQTRQKSAPTAQEHTQTFAPKTAWTPKTSATNQPRPPLLPLAYSSTSSPLPSPVFMHRLSGLNLSVLGD